MVRRRHVLTGVVVDVPEDVAAKLRGYVPVGPAKAAADEDVSDEEKPTRRPGRPRKNTD